MTTNTNLAPDLVVALQQTDEYGRPRYSDREAGDAMALMLISLGGGLDPAALGEGAGAVLRGFVDRAEIKAGTDVEQTRQAVQRYFEKTPLPDGLTAALSQAFRGAAAHDVRDEAGQALARFAGEAPPSVATRNDVEAPAGSIGGGLLAQIALMNSNRDDEK